MATNGEISAALNLIDVKKQNLRESFLHLQSLSQSQSQSPSPSSFNFNFNSTLNWSDIDSYFTTIQSSLQSKFNLLKTSHQSSNTTTILARPELVSFCQKSDGLGLQWYISRIPNRISILAELPDAYRHAPDAASMVLDALLRLYGGNTHTNTNNTNKNSCVIMLEGLMRVKPDVTIELRDKAMEVALEWNRIRVKSSGKGKEQTVLGFLLLVGVYGLIDRFRLDELIECFVIVAKLRCSVDMCRQMIPDDKINDLIQKLVKKGKHATAVKFSIEFQKTDEFPPLSLLEERKLMCMKNIEEMHKKGENHQFHNEISTLNAIISCIDEYRLPESEHLKDAVVNLVKKPENEVGGKKQVVVNKPKKPKLNKFIEAAASAVQTTTQNVMPIQPPHDHVGPYHNSSAVPNVGYSGNPMPAGPGFYHPQSHPPSGYNSNGWI